MSKKMPMKTDTILELYDNKLNINNEMQPRQATLDFILAFAASYEVLHLTPEMPGYVLN
jgi:hypothetical protein